MWRFIRSPRRVIFSAAVAIGLCFCCMIIYAYWNKPRLEVVPVEQWMVDICLLARVASNGETINQSWTSASRKDGRSIDCDELSEILNGGAFLQRYRKAAVQQNPRLSDLFKSTDCERLAFRCKPIKHIEQKGQLLDFNGMIVHAVLSKHFSIRQSPYYWSRWLQEKMPFMPDKAELQKTAAALNQDAVDVLDAQVRSVNPDLEWNKY